ncbi:Uncharacterized conserved protein, DUF1330 family [Shimia gijangensis]|uniref:Uncharacterized conserved protein, DUF1330 family n=1 Tax=Shimia gijangensis TaxID=1470563 RepID=A0A1M6ED17_9RHOB|nr:DUF1330 domain-containing protein [Shimia gijangensis]SHI83365.1 Uncharacterized conserved protein, DUF1330 family [Shimia gijangensis]
MDYVGFDKETFRAFRDSAREGPIHMLNLVRLRDKAQYEDGRDVSGAEAYATYGGETAPIFDALGGCIVWRGKMEMMLIGPDKIWDLCFIAEYPSVQAFVSMISNPDYRKAMVHRQAAVQDSRLIRLEPQDVGANFGE